MKSLHMIFSTAAQQNSASVSNKMSYKNIFLSFRWVVIIAVSYMIIFDNGFNFNISIGVFLSLFIFSNILIGKIPEGYFTTSYFCPVVALADIIIVTAAIYFLGNPSADFYVMYFIIIMLSALGENLKFVLAISSASSLIYTAYLFRTESLDHELPIRLMLLFSSAMFNGLLVEKIKLEKLSRYSLEKLIQTEETIKNITYYDTLTGLPNRKLFDDNLRQSLAHAGRQKHHLAIMFLDIDRFNMINDAHGHNTGDLLLNAIAERLKTCMRKVDTISRFGSDEFSIILPYINQAQDAEIVALKIIRAMEKVFWISGHELYITASIGISLFPGDGNDFETLTKNADTAMNKAKELGKNNYQFYTPALKAEVFERHTLETGLRNAINRKEFRLFYQPQIDLDTGAIVGNEALLRWQHPEFGLLSPKDFIPAAEETGLIIPIGKWLMRAACIQNRIWQKSGYPTMRIAVNLSMRQFRQKNLLETISLILKDTDIHPGSLEIELTESIVMQNIEDTISTLHEMRSLGVHLSIDDFGTGYSSLSYLKYLPISKLKLAQQFVQAAVIDTNDAAISKAIIILASVMNLKVIAEGVETIEQLEFLRSLKCDEVQGYLFSKPLPSEELTQFLADLQYTNRKSSLFEEIISLQQKNTVPANSNFT